MMYEVSTFKNFTTYFKYLHKYNTHVLQKIIWKEIKMSIQNRVINKEKKEY